MIHDSALRLAQEHLLRATRALGPFSDRAIVTGGLVPFLSRRSGEFAPTDLPPLGTSEVDWLFHRPLPSDGPSLREALEGAGFVTLDVQSLDRKQEGPHLLQDKAYGSRRGPVYFELLTPRRGSGELDVVDLEPPRAGSRSHGPAHVRTDRGRIATGV